MPGKKPFALLFFFLLIVFGAGAADVNFPYGNIRLGLPPGDDPLPGFGSYYTTIPLGIKSALWNPASLAKLKLSEAAVSVILDQGVYQNEKTSKLAETSGTFEITSGGGTAGQYGLFFRYPAQIGSGVNTKEVSVLSTAAYATTASGLNFSAAQKVNDWLTVGFSSYSPITAQMNIAGSFPLTARADTNLYGTTIDQMQIQTSGKLKYTFSSGGVVTTYESTQPLWSGFLSQEVTIPVTNISEMRNNLNVSAPYMGTLAGRWQNTCFGLNFIPISGTANINNDIRAVVNADTPDQFIYAPDFDQTSQTDLANWISDPDRYGTATGYQRKQIDLPNGEIVGTGKYNGFYNASASRLDLGMTYDVNEAITFGLALENIGGAALNFQGNGLATFVDYRQLNTAEVTDLFQPGGATSWAPFSNTWITTDEISSTKLMLEPGKNYELPKRVRFGIATKRPFTIALDIENNQVPISVVNTAQGATQNIMISGLTFIRLGVETRLFALPTVVRGGLTFMPKPTITGLTAESQQKIDDVYNNKIIKIMMGNLPVKLDLGSDTNFWGTIVGLSLGVNGQSLINILQFDATSSDLSKIAYAGLTVARDAWQLNYLCAADPTATYAAYSSKTVPAGQQKSFEFSDLKFIQTLGVTYKF